MIMKRRNIIFLTVGAMLAVGCAFLGYRVVVQRTCNGTPTRIYLPEGSSYAALMDTLAAHDLLRGRWTFDLKARLLGLKEHVHAGSYVVSGEMSELALIRKLRSGGQDPIRLTIGKFRLPEDLERYLASRLMHDDFHVAIDSFYMVRPNTYEVYWTLSPEGFMRRMEKEWEVERGKWEVESGKCRNGLTPHDVIVMASIVEEESNHDAEKPLIASVYLNRLRKGMLLQADPTVKYAVGDFTLRRILNKHLATESAYNTYLHPGLPPAPICLPSPSSVRAVLDAPESSYLYFCASPEFDGTHRFASTLNEHGRNAAEYRRALDRRNIVR